MLVCILFLTALLPAQGRAQEEDRAGERAGTELLAQVQRAFAGGNARALLEAASERVEISLFGESTQYSRSQAVYVMQDFFREYPPRAYSFQDRSRTEGSQFAAGRYWHAGTNLPLRVYVGLRDEGEQWTIREIRIEQRE